MLCIINNSMDMLRSSMSATYLLSTQAIGRHDGRYYALGNSMDTSRSSMSATHLLSAEAIRGQDGVQEGCGQAGKHVSNIPAER